MEIIEYFRVRENWFRDRDFELQMHVHLLI